MWRNGRRTGLKRRLLAISRACVLLHDTRTKPLILLHLVALLQNSVLLAQVLDRPPFFTPKCRKKCRKNSALKTDRRDQSAQTRLRGSCGHSPAHQLDSSRREDCDRHSQSLMTVAPALWSQHDRNSRPPLRSASRSLRVLCLLPSWGLRGPCRSTANVSASSSLDEGSDDIKMTL